jgi:tetratricopeptide (TPR) repeat protein
MSVGGAIPQSGPRPKMGAMDILTAIRLKMGALKKAEQHLNRFCEMAPTDRGYFIARIMRNYGLIAKSRGKSEEARDYFAKSVALYKAEEMYGAAQVVEDLMQG